MNSTYQVQSTHYANVALASAHAIVDDLIARADRLAPRFSEETLEAGASNPRPGADSPRRRQVWDMHAEALGWNLIADHVDAVIAAKRYEANGVDYAVALEYTDLGPGTTKTHARVTPILPDAPAGLIPGTRVVWEAPAFLPSGGFTDATVKRTGTVMFAAGHVLTIRPDDAFDANSRVRLAPQDVTPI